MTPQFTHDSDCCTFLGRYHGTAPGYERDYDLYWCGQRHCQTVIARYGDEGREYTSGMSFVGHVDPLTEAHRRAVERGLI